MNWNDAGIAAVVFNAGILFAQFIYMRKAMVTKKDLQIALLQHQIEMAKTYVKKEECDDKVYPMGGAHAHD